jgi:hypothetical protein
MWFNNACSFIRTAVELIIYELNSMSEKSKARRERVNATRNFEPNRKQSRGGSEGCFHGQLTALDDYAQTSSAQLL